MYGTVTHRVQDLFGALWLCDSCADQWQPLQPDDLPPSVDLGLWELPAPPTPTLARR